MPELLFQRFLRLHGVAPQATFCNGEPWDGQTGLEFAKRHGTGILLEMPDPPETGAKDLLKRVLQAKAERRKELAALTWEEKVAIIDQMRRAVWNGTWKRL